MGNSVIEMISPRTYRLTLTPSKSGWNYDNINDPTYGVTILESVVRESDGSSISLRNFWHTDRTLRDGMDPLYEHRIHFIDEFANNNAKSGNSNHLFFIQMISSIVILHLFLHRHP